MSDNEFYPEVTRRGALDMQVCVPKEWSDEQVKEFAESKYSCGTTNGWQVRKQGDEALAGKDERVQCSQKSGCVHVMLYA